MKYIKMITKETPLERGIKIWHPELSNLQIELKDIGDNTIIHSHTWIGKDVKIGSNVKIQAFSAIYDGVTIEDDVFIGPRVTTTNDAKLEVKGKEFWQKTLIKKGAKLGACCAIKAGVTIGEGAIIGMGAIVLENIPDHEVWAGVPAKRIK